MFIPLTGKFIIGFVLIPFFDLQFEHDLNVVELTLRKLEPLVVFNSSLIIVVSWS